MTSTQRIANYLKAGYPSLYLVSYEERRVQSELVAAIKMMATPYTLHVWTITKGIASFKSTGVEFIEGTEDAGEALTAFDKLDDKEGGHVLLMQDFHMFCGDPGPMLVRRLKESLDDAKKNSRCIVVLGCQLKLAPELEKEFTVIEFKLPDKEQLRTVLENVARSAKIKLNGNTDAILDSASGLTCIEAENAFALSIVEKKDIVPEVVYREKAATIKKGGLLEIIEPEIGIEDIGGIEVLKEWISKRRLAFSPEARDYGLPLPRGFLMVGIPGCSKTMTAKAVAKILNVPLLKLDGGKLFGSLVGQSEANIRNVIQTCEAIAPCVVLVDEIEKSFSGSKSSGQTDGGTSARVLGTFLQWMNDKTAPVFVVATANDITQLPPEFLRKGRFDNIFFNDLPTESEREEIWRIQIQRHGRKPKQFDLSALAAATPEWTGAEIEALFREGLFSAFDNGKEPTTQLLMSLAKENVPLSKTMASQVQDLRNWANGKAVRSSKRESQPVESVTRKINA